MSRPAFIKTCLFRSLAIFLLALSTGFVIVPDSNPFSADKTFVKAHAPSDNFVISIKGDDKEDLDEDGVIQVHLSSDFSMEFISWVTLTDDYKPQVKPLAKKYRHHVYLVHRQFLI
jgi:hypothetical protein